MEGCCAESVGVGNWSARGGEQPRLLLECVRAGGYYWDMPRGAVCVLRMGFSRDCRMLRV